MGKILRLALAAAGIAVGLAAAGAGIGPVASSGHPAGAEASASAQAAEPWVLFGYDNRLATTLLVDTTNGLARPLSPSGYQTNGSGMAACRAPVPTTGGLTYPAGTIFAVLRDATFNKDYVVVLDQRTGQLTKIVELDLAIAGRGVAFGPDGSTLYAYVNPGRLYRIGTTDGSLGLVGETRDASGTQYAGTSLEYDPKSGGFLSIVTGSTGSPIGPGRQRTTSLVRIDPTNAATSIVAALESFDACTLCSVPGPVAGPAKKTYPAGTFFTVNRVTNVLYALSVAMSAGKPALESTEAIGSLGPNAANVCAMAFGMRVVPTPTPIVLPTTPGGGPTAKPVPTQAVPSCVCPDILKKAPAVVIYDALANPERYMGWQRALNPNMPMGPGNPVRDCLTIQNPNTQYHPLWNQPTWRVGCP